MLLLILPGAAWAADYGGYRPHYQGYGVDTPGGRGGDVCKVTTLSDSIWPAPPGTLRYCVEEARGPRFVVFEVSGTVHLELGPLFVKHPYITIAGQTAPSPGILIRGPGMIIDTHDVVVQHVRIRVGNIPWDPHSLWIRDNATNVVIDHVSVSWAIWTSVGIYPTSPWTPPGKVTIIDSIVAESLACSGVNSFVFCDPATYPAQGTSNSRAINIGNSAQVTLLRNLLANNNDRHPETGGSTKTFIVNDLIYNPSQSPWTGVFFTDAFQAGPTEAVLKGNVLIPGPTTPGHNGYVAMEYQEEGGVALIKVDPTIHPNSQIYLEDNFFEAHCADLRCLASSSAQWRLAKDWVGESIHATVPPFALDNLPLSSALPHAEVESYLLANAGARPLDRDAVDARIVNEVASRTGSVPNHTSEKAGPGTDGEGFPILAENRHTLAVPNDPHAVVDSVGRTRIEAWLEDFARALEPARAFETSGPGQQLIRASGTPRFTN